MKTKINWERFVKNKFTSIKVISRSILILLNENQKENSININKKSFWNEKYKHKFKGIVTALWHFLIKCTEIYSIIMIN